MDRSLGRIVRALRLRLGWRQADLAHRAGVSARAVSKLERHGPTGFTVRTLQRICEPIEIDLWVNGRWRGGELDRLMDAGHAALQELVKRRLETAAWQVRAEATFSRFGERGSIDLLAFHPAEEVLMVVEIKTIIADVQGLLRPIDVKVRLAADIAAELAWRPRAVVPALILFGREHVTAAGRPTPGAVWSIRHTRKCRAAVAAATRRRPIRAALVHQVVRWHW